MVVQSESKQMFIPSLVPQMLKYVVMTEGSVNLGLCISVYICLLIAKSSGSIKLPRLSSLPGA